MKKIDVVKIVNYWKPRLLLQRWRICVQMVEDETWENNAQIQSVTGREEAVLTASTKTFEDPRALICHELVHLLLDPLDVLITQWKETLPLSEEQKDLLDLQHTCASERVVDHFTEVILRQLQSPPQS